MQQQPSTVERILARLAERAHGVVTRVQLRSAGLTDEQIRQRLQSGALLREYRGVYRVGHRAPSMEARYLAAVRACGPRAALSGHAAAHLLGLTATPPSMPEVTTLTARKVPGVTTRRSRTIQQTIWRGVPVTTPARTLIDLAATLDAEDLARAFHEASIRHHTKPPQIEALLANQPGAQKLRRVLRGDIHVSLSRLERHFLALLRKEGLPLPITNRHATARRVDCRWPDHRLTVELDGYRYHSSRHAWETDRRREREAYARGDDVRRFTFGDVYERPDPILAEVRAALG
jgi:very-short-patch-repair endonuclease